MGGEGGVGGDGGVCGETGLGGVTGLGGLGVTGLIGEVTDGAEKLTSDGPALLVPEASAIPSSPDGSVTVAWSDSSSTPGTS